MEDSFKATKGGAVFSPPAEAELKPGPSQPPSSLGFLKRELLPQGGAIPLQKLSSQVPLPSQHTAAFTGTLAFPRDKQETLTFRNLSVWGEPSFKEETLCQVQVRIARETHIIKKNKRLVTNTRKGAKRN